MLSGILQTSDGSVLIRWYELGYFRLLLKDEMKYVCF